MLDGTGTGTSSGVLVWVEKGQAVSWLLACLHACYVPITRSRSSMRDGSEGNASLEYIMTTGERRDHVEMIGTVVYAKEKGFRGKLARASDQIRSQIRLFACS